MTYIDIDMITTLLHLLVLVTKRSFLSLETSSGESSEAFPVVPNCQSCIIYPDGASRWEFFDSYDRCLKGINVNQSRPTCLYSEGCFGEISPVNFLLTAQNCRSFGQKIDSK